jgi:hypothetical protein
MRRRWGIASFLCMLLAAPAVHAQSVDASVTATDSTSAEPESLAPEQAVVYGAMPGGIHVATAETLAKGVAEISTLSGFGRRTGLLGKDHKLDRAIGDIAFAYGVTDIISVGLSLDGRYDKHFGLAPSGDDGYVGDPHINVRIAKTSGANHFGGQLGVWVPGKDAPSIAASAISVDARGLVSIPAGPGLLSFEAGFRLDNSAKSVDNLMKLSLQDRVSLGVSDYNALFGGAHLQFPAGSGWISLEGSLVAFLGSPPAADAKLAEGTLMFRGGVTGGVHLNSTWSVVAYVEAAKVPGVQAAQVMAANIPVIPYEPAFTGGLGIEARFGGPRATYIEKDCHKHNPPDCPAVKVPLLADLSGSVVDEAGKPVVGAKITFTLKNSQVPATATDASGAWKATGVPVGSSTDGKPTIEESAIEVAVDVDGKKPGKATVAVTAGGAITVPPIQLEPALPPGQVKGVVRSPTGKPIAGAIITASPGDKSTTTGADGTFVLDLAPGQYKVTAKSGASTQDLDVTIDPNGVALKEFVLKK